MLKVAFVVQRCGREVNGGAEAHCLQVAQRMARHWRTEVLTTCALDYLTWANHYPVGEEVLNGTTVRRFAVDAPRDMRAFNRLSEALHPRLQQCSLAEQERWMRAQGPLSRGLADFIADHREDYDAFIFFGYLYATTYFLLPIVHEKAWLAPLAHDEWPICFSMWERLFALPRGLIFNSEEEYEFLQQRFGSALPQGPIAGVGIEPPASTDPAAFCRQQGLKDPFLLYVGRVDTSKGCDELFSYFERLRQTDPTPRKLVVIGRNVMPVPRHDDIIHLGFVDEASKWDAMAACDWLVVPSRYESLSMVLLETWAVGRPAVVNGQCKVLQGHCCRANAGLWYSSFEEFQTALSAVPDTTKRALGTQGAAYVQANYNWERVEQKYLDLLKPILPRGSSVKPSQTVNTQPGMNLTELQANWDEFGKTDPLWAILTAPAKRGGRWESDKFFATGQAEIAEVLNHIQSLGFRLKHRRALDFGCGVGRLTQALCGYFQECDGVDIAPSMIELARQHNRFGARCCYHVNHAADLSLFARGSFDFVYSNIVLQHIRPDYSTAYLREFMRVLVPGGLAVFQLPSEPVGQDSPTRPAGDAVPLSASGFKAQIQAGELPASLKAGSRLTIPARVKNIGGCVWLSQWLADGRYCIQLGDHWLDQGGQMLQNDDGRAPLPHDVQPGQEIELSLQIRAPLVDGTYLLELDMVQEGVAWFKQRGSTTAVTSIQVVGGQPKPAALGPAAAGDTVSQPVMELHGIPKSEVLALLKKEGGRVIDVQRYDVCGPCWNSYRYCVTKKWKASDVWRAFRNSVSRLWRLR